MSIVDSELHKDWRAIFDISLNNEIFDMNYKLTSEELAKPSVILRRRVNDLIVSAIGSSKPTLTHFEAIREILLLGIEHPHDLEFYPPFETLYAILGTPLTVEEVQHCNSLIVLKNYLRKDLISRKGVEELYPDIAKRIIKARLTFDPINLYKRGKNIYHLYQMVRSSDVKQCIEKLGVPSRYTTPSKFINWVKRNRFTYPKSKHFLEEYKIFDNRPESWHRINSFFSTHKFPITEKSISLLKKIRRKKIYGEKISYWEMDSLSGELGAVNFSRVSKIIWKGLSKEYKSIYRMPEGNKREARFQTLLKYYSRHRNWILRVLDNNSKLVI